MKIIIPGGSGQIGQILSRACHAEGHEVVILSRETHDFTFARAVAWDASTLGLWTREIDGSDVVINLTGRSVNCRYNETNRREIIDSRVQSTRVIGEAIRQSTHPPKVWLQMSTATIYAHRYDAPNDEYSGIIGGDEPNVPETWRFSIDVARAWEEAANEIDTPQTRKVLLRSAMVMSADEGGVFDVLLGLARRGLGGRSGNGKQFVSWIHEGDFVKAIEWIIEHPELEGPINLASPNPLPNAAFMQALRHAWGTRIGLAATKEMLEVAAFFMQTETELILKSRRVIPTKLLQSGFKFEFPHWKDAAIDLCAQWRNRYYRSH